MRKLNTVIQEPLTNLSMNIKLFRETLNLKNIRDASDPQQNIIDEIENDCSSIIALPQIL